MQTLLQMPASPASIHNPQCADRVTTRYLYDSVFDTSLFNAKMRRNDMKEFKWEVSPLHATHALALTACDQFPDIIQKPALAHPLHHIDISQPEHTHSSSQP